MSRTDEFEWIDSPPAPTESARSGPATLALIGLVLCGLLVAGWQSYFTVVVMPNRVSRSCAAESRRSMAIAVVNWTSAQVQVVGVTSDCGCFQAADKLPLSIPPRGRREIAVEYSCPSGDRTNTISLMIGGETLSIYRVTVDHRVGSSGR